MALLVSFLLAVTSLTSPSVPTIGPAQAYTLVRRGEAVLIDVREREEIADGMAAPALWMPFSRIRHDPEDFARFVSVIPADRILVFYCAKGGRAEMAAARAKQVGRSVRNMGAFSGWVGAGLPVRIPAASAAPTGEAGRSHFAAHR